jgi:hypothetical protein
MRKEAVVARCDLLSRLALGDTGKTTNIFGFRAVMRTEQVSKT